MLFSKEIRNAQTTLLFGVVSIKSVPSSS